jgi:hypothetical protein
MTAFGRGNVITVAGADQQGHAETSTGGDQRPVAVSAGLAGIEAEQLLRLQR